MGFCLHRPPSLLASPTSTDTPQRGGEDFGIIGRGGGLSTPSCRMWGSVFPVESGCSRAGTACNLLSCSAASSSALAEGKLSHLSAFLGC